MKKIKLNSIGEHYSNFATLLDYQKVIDDETNSVIYTTDSVIMANRKEISKHYGSLKYISNGYFFFVPLMSEDYKIGILRMDLDDQGELIPFSEQTTIFDTLNDLIVYVKENNLSKGLSIIEATFNNEEEDAIVYSYNKIRYQNKSDFIDNELKSQPRQKQLVRKPNKDNK